MNTNIDLVSRPSALSHIKESLSLSRDPFFIVTAYSEFFVLASSDSHFRKAINSADLVTPDGISVLAAARYIELSKGKGFIGKVLCGLSVGSDVLFGRLGKTVTGVWLFDELTSWAAENNKKVFLLGGWDNVASRASKILLKRFPRLQVEYDEGERLVGTDSKKNRQVIKHINSFSPDILFVAYNPVKQEKWIFANREQLKCGVVIGVGGTFNEFVGDLPGAPALMTRSGLTWLWRLMLQPKRFRRILRAVVLFPWLVFKNSL